MNKCGGLFSSACMVNTQCIPLTHCTLDSLDIFNLILIVLRLCLTGLLFDLILKFRAARTALALPFLFSLMVPLLPCLNSLCSFIHKCV